MRAGALTAGLLMASAAASHVWTEQEVMAERAGTLRGTLTLPEGGAEGSGAVPGVVIVAGSGPVDRDGNLPGMPNDSLKLLARGLAEQGIASVRFDKRGVGASRGAGLEESELRFGDYVHDAAAWADRLRAERRVSEVALLGHSEGALVATMATAAAVGASRLVLVAGAGIPAGPLMARQFSAGGLPADLKAELHRILRALTAGVRVDDVPAPLQSLLRPSVQPYLTSWLPIDPAVELSRVGVPVLVVQGTTDIQVGVADARILAAARPGAALVVIDGMNHVLRSAPADRAGNVATYRNPALPLAPGLVAAVARFLSA